MTFSAQLFCDGGARGNPGPAAGGAVLCALDGKVLAQRGVFLGDATNNQAEYRALGLGLQLAKETGVSDLQIFLDSKLVVQQVLGHWKIKDPTLRIFRGKIHNLLADFSHWEINHIPREKNKLADGLVNAVLDQQIG